MDFRLCHQTFSKECFCVWLSGYFCPSLLLQCEDPFSIVDSLGKGPHTPPRLRDSNITKGTVLTLSFATDVVVELGLQVLQLLLSSRLHGQHQIPSSGSGSKQVHKCLLSSVDVCGCMPFPSSLRFFCYEVSFESRHCPEKRFFCTKNGRGFGGVCVVFCLFFCSHLPTYKVKDFYHCSFWR